LFCSNASRPPEEGAGCGEAVGSAVGDGALGEADGEAEGKTEVDFEVGVTIFRHPEMKIIKTRRGVILEFISSLYRGVWMVHLVYYLLFEYFE
jgi:hypothetical protein